MKYYGEIFFPETPPFNLVHALWAKMYMLLTCKDIFYVARAFAEAYPY